MQRAFNAMSVNEQNCTIVNISIILYENSRCNWWVYIYNAKIIVQHSICYPHLLGPFFLIGALNLQLKEEYAK